MHIEISTPIKKYPANIKEYKRELETPFDDGMKALMPYEYVNNYPAFHPSDLAKTVKQN